MNKFIMLAITLISMVAMTPDADAARRLGGGSNLGSQRSIAPPAPKSPAQQVAPAATPAQQQAGNKWLGPLAGLALGAGLASLFLNNGFAGGLGGILMVMLVAAAAFFAIRLLKSKMQPSSRPLQYAGAGAGAGPGMPRIGSDLAGRPEPSGGSDLSSHFGGGAAAAVKRFPPGFDADQFARHAKSNFIRLQAANDARDVSTMRDFMTPELYSGIVADLDARVATPQKTDVVTLDSDVVEVVTEGARYVASVRFSGTIRDGANAAAEPFSEVWHLEKPVDGSSGWLISGIQQDS